MMKMNTNILSAVFLSVLLFTACKEEQLGPLESDGTPPGPVSNVTVENLPGGALISYDTPGDTNLLYVKAVYHTNAETVREAKAYWSNNQLLVEGFGTTGEFDVTLTAVAESEAESEPVTVTINPLTPPVLKILESLETAVDFGGMSVAFQNEDEAEVVINVITTDEAGDWVSADNVYTSTREGNFAVRGFAAEPRTFGVFIIDRWENSSDTLFTELTPLHEVQLDKSRFQDVRFPSDGGTNQNNAHQQLSNTWNGYLPTPADYVASGNTYISDTSGLPMSLTIDLGQTAQLSRMRFWQRMGTGQSNPTGTVWGDRNPRIFEIWGSNVWSEDWDDWELLATFESTKPSGLPIGQITSEDLEAALAGEEFIFPVPSPAVRFIRWNILNTWVAGPGNTGASVHMTEMTFWGDVID